MNSTVRILTPRLQHHGHFNFLVSALVRYLLLLAAERSYYFPRSNGCQLKHQLSLLPRAPTQRDRTSTHSEHVPLSPEKMVTSPLNRRAVDGRCATSTRGERKSYPSCRPDFHRLLFKKTRRNYFRVIGRRIVWLRVVSTQYSSATILSSLISVSKTENATSVLGVVTLCSRKRTTCGEQSDEWCA